MSRSEINNPTNRIGQMLDDFDALEAAYNLCAEVLATISPAAFERLGAKPPADAILKERVRRQLTLGKVEYKRTYMRLQRARVPEASLVRELTPEEEASIMAELERDGSAPADQGS